MLADLEREPAMTCWSVVAASVTGPSHEEADEPGQDAHAWRAKGRRLVAVVADGAGSAAHGGLGARTVTTMLADALLASPLELGVAGTLSAPWCDAVAATIEAARARLAVEPGAPDAPLEAHHATIVGCVCEDDGGFFFHIGDGIGAAVHEPEDWSGCTLSRPENGEYANETYFFTQEVWRQHLRFTPFRHAEAICLVSDGAAPFTMAEKLAGLEGRFVAPLAKYFASTDEATASQALRSTLDAAGARRISKDDKTLLWARRLPEA